MIDAQQARNLSNAHQSERALIDEIDKQIKEAALDGKWQVRVDALTDFTRHYLKDRGYIIKNHELSNGGVFHVIHWHTDTMD